MIVDKVRRRRFRPDVILARSSVYDLAPLGIAERLDCPLVLECNTPFVYECCDVRRTFVRSSVERFESGILAACDGVYCVSEVLAQMLTDTYSVPRQRMVVVPNGYSPSLYLGSSTSRQEVRNRIRHRWCANEKVVVTFVGSLQTWHGIEPLLDLAAAFRSRSDIEFWIIGDGALRDLVLQHADAHGNVRWFGNVPAEDMRDLLYASDLGIMPYHRLEHFYFSPLKMYDMVGAGLPFIATDIGQIADFCRDHLDDGFLFASASTEEMSRALDSVIGVSGRLGVMRARVEAASGSCSWTNRAEALTTWMSELTRE